MAINLSDIFAGSGSGGGVSWGAVDLVDAPTVEIDWSSGSLFTLEIAGNRVIANPTNDEPAVKILRIQQDGTGMRSVTWGDRYVFENDTPPVLSTDPHITDVFKIVRFDDGTFYVSMEKGFDLPQIPRLALSTYTLDASTVVGGSPASQTFEVQNTGDLSLNFAVAETSGWLSVSPTSGSTTTSETITVTYDTDALVVGDYSTDITVTSDNGEDSPKVLTVNLSITAVPSSTINTDVSSLTVSATEGHDASAQTFNVSNTGAVGSTLAYTVSDDAGWLSVSPASGSLAEGASEELTVTYTTDALALGTYTGTITISASNCTNSPVNIGVSLEVVEAPPIDIGTAGTTGFGVGIAPAELTTLFGLTGMTGYTDPSNANYGNYTDASGSVMVFIPRHYVKLSYETAVPYSGLRVDVSNTQDAGYSLPRCFVNNGVEVLGIFVDKYLMGKEGTVGVSKRNLDPCSCSSSHNPISALTSNGQTPANQCDGFYSAVKTRGNNYSVISIFTYTMLANLADAHYQACYLAGDYSACAWADVEPYQPKGCNNGSLKDVNDASVVYTSSGYSSCGMTGGVTDAVFAKITHNGQKCGVTDVNGNIREAVSGWITDTSSAEYILKESTDIKVLTANGAYTTSNYDALTTSIDLSARGSVYYGNGTNQMFSGDTTRTANAYKNDNLGLPINDASMSASGTQRFGQDQLYKDRPASRLPIVSGGWAYGSSAGVRHHDLDSSRTYSGYNLGSRACLVPWA